MEDRNNFNECRRDIPRTSEKIKLYFFSKPLSRVDAVIIEQSILAKYRQHQYVGTILKGSSNREFFTKDIYEEGNSLWDEVQISQIKETV